MLVLATCVLSSFGRNTTAADHAWPKASRGPLRVAFTFDDGPNGQATKDIVDILVAKNVPATFFEVGQSIAADPETTRYVADHGFIVANHSWDHSWNIPHRKPAEIRHELERTNDIIRQVTGETPTLMRWPHGAHSLQDDAVVRSMHMRAVTWNIDPKDYNTQDPDLLAQRVVAETTDKSVILLHDNLQDGQFAQQFHDRRGTIAALSAMIDALRGRGAEFLSLPDMLDVKYGHPTNR